MFNSDAQAISAIQSAADHLSQSTSASRDKLVDASQLVMVLQNLLRQAPRPEEDQIEYEAALGAASSVLESVTALPGKGIAKA